MHKREKKMYKRNVCLDTVNKCRKVYWNMCQYDDRSGGRLRIFVLSERNKDVRYDGISSDPHTGEDR